MRNILLEHKRARESIQTILHQFRASYKNNSTIIYTFFEGSEDSCYYMNHIQNAIPEKWNVKPWICGSKKGVYKVHEKIEIMKYTKEAVIFFVDKDLSEYIKEENREDVNIYVTKYYSIENELVNSKLYLRVMKEIYNMNKLTEKEEIMTVNRFEIELKRFYEYVTPIMAWFIYFRRKGKGPNIKNIKMRTIMKITKGKIKRKNGYNNNYLYRLCSKKCNIIQKKEDRKEIEKILLELGECKNKKEYVRGKYELWFMVEHLKYVYNKRKEIYRNIKEMPKKHLDMGMHNAMLVMAPRARATKSLKDFIERTCIRHIKKQIRIRK